MKTLLTTAVALLSVLSSLAGGVEFIEGSWEEARRMAASQNKYILVDAYTDWCYWCKVQDKETFSRDDVGEMVNASFVPVKINFEEGIGVQLAMKYRVQGYPTLLFFNPEGRLVGRVVGYNSDPKAWIEEVSGMLDTEKHPPSNVDPDDLDLAYPDFFVNSFTRDGQRGKQPSAEEVSAWLDEQEDPYSEVAFCVIKMRQTNDQWNDFFIEHAKDYIQLYGQEEVDDKISSIFFNKGWQAMNEGDEAAIDAIADEAGEKVGEDLAQTIRVQFKMDLYMKQERYAEYMELAEPMFTNEAGELNHGMINSVCWNIYENTDDEGLILKAIDWMGKVVEKHAEYNYLDTYAALFYAAGQLDKAESWAKRAIAVGEAEESDTGATQDLMEKIEAARAE